jgi:hypothetical protein
MDHSEGGSSIIQRLAFLAWPDLNHGLRLVSILGGIGALLAHWQLSRAALSSSETVISVGLLSASTELIRYSSMVNPSILDALFSTLILAVAISLFSSHEKRIIKTAALAVVGVLCTLFSFGGLIVLASTGLVLFSFSLIIGDRRWSAELALTGLVWIASMSLLYALVFKEQSTTVGNMVDLYWGGSFAPAPTSAHALAWYYRTPARVFGFLLAGLPAALTLTAMALGAVTLAWRRIWIAALLVSPMLVAILISSASAYPFDTRFQLALAPPAILLLSAAIGWIAHWTPRPTLAFICVGAPLLALPALAAGQDALKAPPWAHEEIEPNLNRLAQAASDRDLILATPAAERPLLLYAKKAGLFGLHYAVTADHRGDARCSGRGLSRLPSTGRAWLITYHEDRLRPATLSLLVELARRGKITGIASEPGSRLYRVDLVRSVPEDHLPGLCYQPRKSIKLLSDIARIEGLLLDESR